MNRKSYNELTEPNIIACIEWMDASTQKGPLTLADLAGVHVLRSVGWLIRENEEQVTIAMDYVPGNEEYRDVQHILKRNVITRKEYKAKA